MMGAVAELLGGGKRGLGFLDPADYQRTVDVLLAGGSHPVITEAPEGAWTHKIWEAMQ
jgi:NitT/TauT family transport system substrate-binding protein